MPTSIVYKTSVTATGGRDGRAKTANGSLDIELAAPKEMGGSGSKGNNPEELFGAGYAACFLGAIRLIASQKKVTVPKEASVTANIGLGPRAAGGFELEVALEVHLPELNADIAKSLMDEAHQICPYSNATRNNIDVKLSLV